MRCGPHSLEITWGPCDLHTLTPLRSAPAPSRLLETREYLISIFLFHFLVLKVSSHHPAIVINCHNDDLVYKNPTFIFMLDNSPSSHNADSHYAVSHYADSHYAESHYQRFQTLKLLKRDK